MCSWGKVWRGCSERMRTRLRQHDQEPRSPFAQTCDDTGMSTDDRLRTLDSLLLAVTDEDGMLLSEFDGFCAGVLVSPAMIPPSE